MVSITNIIIAEPDFVLKTQMQDNTKNFMKNRYASGIVIVLCGKLEFIFEDQAILCRENEAVFVPEGKSYKIICHEYAESFVINFHILDNDCDAMALHKINRKLAETIFKDLNVLLLNADENRNAIMSLYYQLLSVFLDKKRNIGTSDKYVKHAESIIHNDFSLPALSCRDIAKDVNISEIYLRKLFIKHHNMPISKYLLSVRMNHAQHLILEGYSVSETAFRSGYSDIYQFSRAYKKYFGFSPSKTN